MEPKQVDETENRLLLKDFASTLASVRVDGGSAEYRKPVNMLPRHGVFFRWPEQPAEDWISAGWLFRNHLRRSLNSRPSRDVVAG